MGRVFPNGLGDLGSFAGHVIPKTLKMVLDTPLLHTRQYKVGIMGKVKQSRERSSALPYSSSSYWKGSLLVTLDYGRQIYLLLCASKLALIHIKIKLPANYSLTNICVYGNLRMNSPSYKQQQVLLLGRRQYSSRQPLTVGPNSLTGNPLICVCCITVLC